MADSEELRLKRLKHEERLSRVFDEVMGLGDFADSSRGSATSSKSGGPEDETKEGDKNLPQEEHQIIDEDEEDSKGGRPEEKIDEELEELSLPHISSTSSERHSLFTMRTKKAEGAGKSGGAAFDDAVDGMEDDEDWHFALPMGSMEDDQMGSKRPQTRSTSNLSRRKPFSHQSRAEEDEEEDEEMTQDRDGSSESNTSHSSQEHTPENSRDGGVLDQTEETEDSQEGERSELAPMEESNTQTSPPPPPPPPPPIRIKDEPIDEGYDAALLPQSSIRQIKEELEQQEEELRISSVYSVGGANTFAPSAMPSTVPPQPPATIFIPSPGTVLQAMAPLPVRPSVPVQSSLTALAPVPQRPPQPPIPGSVRCSGCSKILLKGQTAFQRKGSTQLFCSTVCLTGYLPPVSKGRSCFQCNREILQPRDMITIPTGNNSYAHFCGQFCLSVFRHKSKQPDIPGKWPEKRLERKPEKPVERPLESQICSVCKIANRPIEHEVTHQGRLHRLCSNACFVTWRKMRQLAMNCCEGCGLYCNSNSGSCQTLTLDRSQLNFCSPTCISTYKQTCRKVVECPSCHKMAVASSTIMERDQKGKVQLYCSTSCVEQSRPSQHALSGAAFPCCQCKVLAVPQYHLAMVDGTIRNFCSYNCVSTYRKCDFNPQSDLTNGTSTLRDPSAKLGHSGGASSVPPIPQDYSSSVPYQGHHPSHTSVPPLVNAGQAHARAPAGQPLKESVPVDPSRLTCHQCIKQFSAKPMLLSHQGRIFMFCTRACCEQFKTLKNVLAVCESCKQEKVLFDTISYNQQDMHFCSENCKLLFKHEQISRNKDHTWRPCTYCSGVSQKMLHSHYGGKLEEFCRPHCMSQYTVLYYGMGRCDCCRKQSNMAEKLQCLGSVRNFCNLPCVLQYCFIHFERSQHSSSNGPAQPNHSSKMNPVIADVVSLANGSAAQPSVSAATVLTGALPTSNVDGKNLDHASTQTDAMRVPVPRRRQMKNKSVLCRPFTTDQETSCQLSESSTESAAFSISTPALLESSSNPGPPTCDASTSPVPSPKSQGDTRQHDGVPARLTGRHFLGKRESEADCKVCSQQKRKRAEEDEKERKKKKITEGEESEKNAEEVNLHREEKEEDQKSEIPRSRTPYYCKTCAGEPSLCAVPCFELYHTRLIYRTAPELETQAPSKSSAVSRGDQEAVKVLMVPVPVPVYIPVPLNMYSQHTPVPLTLSLPLPIPLVVPPEKKDVKDAAVQSESVTEDKQIEVPVSAAETDQNSSHCGGGKSGEVTTVTGADEGVKDSPQADEPSAVSAERSAESAGTQPEESTITTDPPACKSDLPKPTNDPPTSSTEHQAPSSPMMDLETDFPPESSDLRPPAPQRGVKRPREGYSGRKRGRRRISTPDRGATAIPDTPKVNHLYGVKAWKSWVQRRNKGPTEIDIKEDILQCDSAELSYALSHFIQEARRPNGEPYSADSIFYLCLGIQQYLFMKGRIENIFTDELYSRFASEISTMLRLWKPQLLPSGGAVSSRILESYLWECKQLGAYSPIVLLNTLLFFCTKNFGFTTVAQHQSLSFVNFTRSSRPCSRAGKVHYLRHHRRSSAAPHREEMERLRKRQTEEQEDLEMLENVINPLHCPVRLYEFYLSRCPQSVKERTDVFYLQPEQNVHTHSSHWYTCQPLASNTLENMLTRILAVREVHHERETGRNQSSATGVGASLQ